MPVESEAVDLEELEPVEVARRCRHLPQLVFFDSAVASGSEVSIIAADPVNVITGSSESDWSALEEELFARAKESAPDLGFPRGIIAGAVDFDGSFEFGVYERLLVYQHAEQQWYAIGDPLPLGRLPEQHANPAQPLFVPQVSASQFCTMVEQAKNHIVAGDIYQINLSQQFTADWCGDNFHFYKMLRHYSPAPYAAYLEQQSRTILSSSPELFLRMSGRTVQTRPIKGTRPRRADRDADEKSAYDLLTSQKEIAELVMITDLERNDLGKVCEYGSVRVLELLKLERYEQVFHLVSTIEGQLRRNISHVAALRSCFPGGSITGAPKKRVCEIIAELEPQPRALYTGSIGYFGFNGESQFNIAIRTVVIEGGSAHFHVGAGIVADSDPRMEYQETLDKAAGILLTAERM